MGRVKEARLELEQQGWNAPDTFVCANCVEDEYLKSLLTRSAQRHTCDYCKKARRAAPMSVLVEAVFAAARTYYRDPGDAGVPYEGGYLIDGIPFEEVLEDLGFEGNLAVFQAVAASDLNGDLYVQASSGDWMGSEPHEVLSFAWQQFAHTVKHETRFHFEKVPPTSEGSPYEMDVRETLPAVAGRLHSCITTLPAGTEVYRARIRRRKETWKPVAKELGAPEPAKARAGRMNPPGIPYLYTSFDPVTTRRELGVGARTSHTVFCGTFMLSRPLTVIDLTQLPAVPSVFDLRRKDERDDTLFIRQFVRVISAPVKKDGQEHIEYVPSQVMCEYLAQIFKPGRGRRLGGLVFPSAAHPGGKNLVVFPDDRGAVTFHGVNFVHARR